MRKISLVLVLFCCMLFGACGAGSQEGDGQAAENATNKTDAVWIGDTQIALNGSFEAVSEALGTVVDYTESKSCLYDGYDKTYAYEEVIIITSPIDGKEIITSITVLSEAVEHALLAGIGSSAEEIKNAYSAENLDISEYCIIWEGDFGIAFYLADGVVTEIEIYVL